MPQLRLQFGKFLIGYLKQRGIWVRVGGSSSALLYVNVLVKVPQDLDLEFKTTDDFTKGLKILQELKATATQQKPFICSNKQYDYSLRIDADDDEEQQFDMFVTLKPVVRDRADAITLEQFQNGRRQPQLVIPGLDRGSRKHLGRFPRMAGSSPAMTIFLSLIPHKLASL
jgi:hypothetical protein